MIQPQRQESDLPEDPRHDSPELRLFLKMPDWEELRRPPSRLASTLGLHVYSDALLTKRVRIEMNLAAFILLIVATFELIAWAFLFNAIFNSDILYLGWKTVPAVLVASLFAAAVFWFERQFLTTDESQRRQAKRAAVIRVLFILAAGITTAQPLELLFFRKPVQKRIHEEGIRKEAVERFNELSESSATEEKYDSDIAERKAKSVADIKEELARATERRLKLELQLGAARASAYAEQGRVEQLRRERDAAGENRAQEAQRRYSAAITRFNRLSGEVLKLEGQTEVAVQEGERLQTEKDNAEVREEDFGEARRAKERLANGRLRDWIRQLRRSEPAEPIVEERPGVGSEKPWEYDDPEYDFFEQLHLVWLLAEGQPPRWLAGAPDTWQLLEKNYGFPFTGPALGWQPHLLLSIVACHIIAFFIPLLVLTIKIFLMPRDLQIYYSRRHQAEAGDNGAWLTQVVDEKVKGEE
jgi:hypothetical protein